MKDLNHYRTLSILFRYPSSELRENIKNCTMILERYSTDLLSRIEPFINHVNNQTLEFQQEYYTSTFDVQPVSTLDIGYVLFGDDYKRGVFLVNIKREHIKVANHCGTDLPDHLPNVLTLLPMIKESELAEELICSLLIPALTEMISRFRKAENHYRSLLEILLYVMEHDFPSSPYERFQFTLKTKVE
jgi:nitrate reductase molybdenum cofactor assembly chaperone